MTKGFEAGRLLAHGQDRRMRRGLCRPKGRVIEATIRKDSFDLEPMNPAERCTPLSVAAHTLYEKAGRTSCRGRAARCISPMPDTRRSTAAARG